MGLFSRKPKPVELAQAAGPLSVLALANEASALDPVFKILSKQENKTKLVTTLSDCIVALQELQPDVILVSLNLKGADSMAIITMFQKLDLPVIGFGESDDEETCLNLLRIELRHVIIPPLTFESFMERVEFLAMEKDLIPMDDDQAAPTQERPWGKIIHLLNEKLLVGGTAVKAPDAVVVTGEIHESSLEKFDVPMEDLIQVDDNDLQIGKTLEIDVFISMPLNHKCILYLRRGSVLIQEHMDRLERYGKARILKRRTLPPP
jgi:CheY-like chemotaxis protein